MSFVQCFLYLVSSSVNVSIFHHMVGCLLDRPHIFSYKSIIIIIFIIIIIIILILI